MRFQYLLVGPIEFDEFKDVIQYILIVCLFVRNNGNADPGGLPDVLQSDFGDGNVEFFAYPVQDRF